MNYRSGALRRFLGYLFKTIAWALLCTFWPAHSWAEIRVEHVTSSAVYLDSGRAEGLEVGDRLRVVDRSGKTVAELEIAFVAEHSSSCPLVDVSALPEVALEVVPYVLRSPSRPIVEPASKPIVLPRLEERPAVSTSAGKAVGKARQPWARPSGSFSLGYQQFSNTSEYGSDLRESTVRLNLRLRELGRLPVEMRIRMRGRESRRGDRVAERRDRFYEASVGWSPAQGRFTLVGGRIGASPFRGLGNLDGVLAAYRPFASFEMGAFAGSRPDLRELGFTSDGTKYGAYFELSHRARSGGLAEVIVAGVGEYDRDGLVSREYVVLETRFGGGIRWSLYQAAELDLSRDWADSETIQPAQLSLLSLSGSFRLSQYFRVVLSFDQRQAYREAESRNISEVLFDDLVRQGLRIGLHFGSPRRWTGSVSYGQRERQSDEPVHSVIVSTYSHGWGGRGISMGFDASGYSGGTTEGFLATLRARKTWRSGHEASLVFGGSSSSLPNLGIDRVNYWGRLNGKLELPASFYLRGGVELNLGDDLEGQRYLFEIGYRF